MKTIPVGLQAVYASGAATICVCLLVQRADAVIERFTSADRDVTLTGSGAPFDGTYGAATGLDVTTVVGQSSLAVDNLELTVLPDEVSYPQADILAGRWNGAKFWLFECSWADPTLGINILKRGTTGEADTLRATRKFEFRGLKQALQQPVGAVTSKTCRARLGDELCTIDLAPFTHDYAVTGFSTGEHRRMFVCSSAVEASDYYGEGTATGLTGPNAGFSQKVQSFAAGVFTLSLPMPFPVSVADTFRFVAGCRHRLVEDCKTKFDNVLNFQGEPHVPGTDAITKDPEVGGA